jgi:lipopolysaccharide/colanic/teichoic acid biosynthesis glycosyltransferase
VPQFIEFYTPHQRDVMLAIRPGLTDYAAIVFRDESSLIDGDDDPIDVYRREIMPVKFAYYERCTREIGILNDLRIVVATVVMVVSGQIPNWLGVEHRLRMPITAAQKPSESRSVRAISR